MELKTVLDDIFYGENVGVPTVFTVLDEDTALHIAARGGKCSYVLILLANGADVNAIGDLGFTPLHDAVQWDHISVAKLLIEHGASTEIRNEDGKKPFEIAKSETMKRMIESYTKHWSRKR